MKLPFDSAAATSDLPQSAIHVDLDTGDVRGVLGRKKRYGAGAGARNRRSASDFGYD
jgi:hypothetical protein